MTFRHLKIFLSVCEHNSMTRAAQALYLTQPSVSQAVAELEEYYQVRLFERLKHRLYLTAAGERLLSYARHLLNLAGEAQKELAGLNHNGSIRIGATLTIGAYLLPRLMVAFKSLAPAGVEVFTLVDNTHVIEGSLLEDRLDIGLVEGPVYDANITEEPLCSDELVVIAAPDHPLANLPDLPATALEGQGFIVRETGSGTRDVFERAMHAAGVGWKVSGVHNNIEAIKQAVLINLALGVVPRIAIHAELQQGRLTVLPVRGLALTRKFNLVYHRQKYFTRTMQTFRAAVMPATAPHQP